MATAPTKKAPATKRRKRKGKNLLSGFDASVEEQSALDQYLRDVSRHELITPDREKELGARAQKGDGDAGQLGVHALVDALAAARRQADDRRAGVVNDGQVDGDGQPKRREGDDRPRVPGGLAGQCLDLQVILYLLDFRLPVPGLLP